MRFISRLLGVTAWAPICPCNSSCASYGQWRAQVKHQAAQRLTTEPVRVPRVAGKTTLLNTLSGKASYGVRTGDILVNGRPDRLERYKPVMGFVPQVSGAVSPSVHAHAGWHGACLPYPPCDPVR